MILSKRVIKIEKERIYDLWFLKKGVCKNTQNTYRNNMNMLLQHMHLDLSTLYDLFSETSTIDNSELEYLILKSFDNMKEVYSNNTLRSIRAMLYSFCTAYNFQPPKIKIKKGGKIENYRRCLKKNEILLFLEYADIKTKAIISLGTMSGFRNDEIRHITISSIVSCINDNINKNYNDIFEVLDNKEYILSTLDVYMYTLLSRKTNNMYTTFIASESLCLIFKYLQTLTCDEINETDYLFRTSRNKQLSQNCTTVNINRLSKKIQFDKNKQKYQYGLFTQHQLRRYFYTTVLNTVGIVYADLWTGHKLSDVRNAYTRVNETMTEKYRECLPHLSLEHNLDHNDLEEYEMLKEKQALIEKSYELLLKMDMLHKL